MDNLEREHKSRIRSTSGLILMTLAIAGFGGSIAPAFAQVAQKESVRGRPRLDFESYGISLDMLTSPDDRSDSARLTGSFDVFPKVTVETGYDSNVAHTDDDEIASPYATVAAEVGLHSNWTNHEALVILGVENREVTESSRESTTDLHLGGTVKLDVDDGIFARGFAEARRDHISRGNDADPGPPFEPLTYNQYVVGGLFDDRRNDHMFKRVVLDFTHRDYNPTDGVDRDNLNRSAVSLRGLVGYTPGGEYDLFISPSLLRETYAEEVSEDQNSTRLTMSIGAARDINGISAVTGRVGVSHRVFDESSRDSQTDFVLSGSMLWNLTPVMTLTAGADIENQQSDDPTAGTRLSRSFNLGLDYDPMEELILGGFLSVANEDYKQIDREDDDFVVGLNATYLINEYLFAGLRFEHDVSDSTDTTRAFEATTIAFRIGAKFCCRTDDGVVNPFDLGRY